MPLPPPVITATLPSSSICAEGMMAVYRRLLKDLTSTMKSGIVAPASMRATATQSAHAERAADQRASQCRPERQAREVESHRDGEGTTHPGGGGAAWAAGEHGDVDR